MTLNAPARTADCSVGRVIWFNIFFPESFRKKKGEFSKKTGGNKGKMFRRGGENELNQLHIEALFYLCRS